MILFTDGGARGNPGPAAIGVVLKNDNEEIIKEVGLYLGVATNNEAEYKGLIKGLQVALEVLGETVGESQKNIKVFMDSELIVKQILGQYKVKNANLQILHREAVQLKNKFDYFHIEHVKRALNKDADRIVNEVLDSTEA